MPVCMSAAGCSVYLCIRVCFIGPGRLGLRVPGRALLSVCACVCCHPVITIQQVGACILLFFASVDSLRLAPGVCFCKFSIMHCVQSHLALPPCYSFPKACAVCLLCSVSITLHVRGFNVLDNHVAIGVLAALHHNVRHWHAAVKCHCRHVGMPC